MKRRVCETCFFFESADLHNSGWCRHPDRQFGAGVRLVVRGNEIACRNGWDADLWVSSEIDPNGSADVQEASLSARQDLDQLTSILPARYEPPEAPPTPVRPSEDIVVGHAPFPGYVAPEKDARDLVTNPRLAILRAREQFKTRQKREGRLSDGEQHPPLIVDATNDFPASDWDLPDDKQEDWNDYSQENAPFLGRGAAEAPSRQINIVPPVSREEIQRPYPTITWFAEDVDRFESVPDSSFPVASRRAVTAPDLLTASDLDFEAEESWVGEESFDDNFVSMDEGAAPLPTAHRRRESLFDRFLRERRERRDIGQATPISTQTGNEFDETVFDPAYQDEVRYLTNVEPGSQRAPQPGMLQQDWEPDYSRSPRAERDFVAKPPNENLRVDAEHSHYTPPKSMAPNAFVHSQQRDEQFTERHDNLEYRDLEDDLAPPYARAREWELPPDSSNRNLERQPAFSPSGHPSMRYADMDDREDELERDFSDLPRWNDDLTVRAQGPTRRSPIVPVLNVDIPKICRTCRDFRPSETPERGWCNNAWAFNHRRMVDADTLSCGQSTLGPWWTANDGYWQGPADASRHARETPLLDRLLASRVDHYETMRRTGNSNGR